MFITVHRLRCGRPLRLAVYAIGYLESHPEGTTIRMIGDHALQVRQSADEIEAFANGASITRSQLEILLDPRRFDAAPIDWAKEEQDLTALEGAGSIDGKQVATQRIDRATRRGRGARA